MAGRRLWHGSVVCGDSGPMRPSSVTGVEPSPGFLEAARVNLGGRAKVLSGEATSIPLGNEAVDVVVSGLVLHFVEDPGAALLEMRRVTSGPGRVAACVPEYGGRMDLMRCFWDAAGELDPAARSLDEGNRFPSCRPDPLRRLFEGAGFHDVEVAPIHVSTPFAGFDD